MATHKLDTSNFEAKSNDERSSVSYNRCNANRAVREILLCNSAPTQSIVRIWSYDNGHIYALKIHLGIQIESMN